MAHTHDHDESYFLDQIFSIALCGALGGIAVLLYIRKTMLGVILDISFHPYVLAGGIALLILVAIRAVALWQIAGEAGATTAHDHHHHHDHAHGHDHHHDHEHCDHDHHHEHETAKPAGVTLGLPVIAHPDAGESAEQDPAHDHGWAPWRYTILMLPVVLFLLNLPNDGHTARVKHVDVEDGLPETAASTAGLLASPGGAAPLLAASALYPGRDNKYGDGVVKQIDYPNVAFTSLEEAAFDSEKRNRLSGKSVTVIGKFAAQGDSNQFGLVRSKMNCCAADALPLNAVLMVNPSWTGERLEVASRQQEWVQVTGRLFFLKKRGRENEFATAVIVFPDKDHPPNELVEVIAQPANIYAR